MPKVQSSAPAASAVQSPRVFHHDLNAKQDDTLAAMAQIAASRLYTTVTLDDKGVARAEDGSAVDVAKTWPSSIERCDSELRYWEEATAAPGAKMLASLSRTLQAVQVMANLIGGAASETAIEPPDLVLAPHEVSALAGGIAELAEAAHGRLVDETHRRDFSLQAVQPTTPEGAA